MRNSAWICLATCLAVLPALAQSPKPPDVLIIWMGGNDCPPCRMWRMTELPKLEQNAEFKAVRFSYVEKLIGSAVPPMWFLPHEIRPYKDQLDEASGGLSGSPQVAIVVNGKIYDYFHAPRKAEVIEKMLVAIRTGGEYPFKRCLKFESWSKCEVSG